MNPADTRGSNTTGEGTKKATTRKRASTAKTAAANKAPARKAAPKKRATRKSATPGKTMAKAPSGAPQPKPITPEARHQMIALGAYLRAERRGFAPGGEIQDWLESEKEVDTLLLRG